VMREAAKFGGQPLNLSSTPATTDQLS